MTVVLEWTAGHVVATPIAYDPEERARALAFSALRWSTWRAALNHCQAEGVLVFNEESVRRAAAVQQPELPFEVTRVA